MKKSKVTIVGGSIPGLCLSLILNNMGLDVCVIERRTLPHSVDSKPSARTAAIMHGSLGILEEAGVWPDIRGRSAVLKYLTIIDDSFFPYQKERMIRQDFDARELNLDYFGYNIPLSALHAALADRVRGQAGITFLENISVDQSHPAVTDADLVIGADGRQSAVREWGHIPVREKSYDQSAVTCVIRHSLSHEDRSVEFHRPGGSCTFVPVDDHVSAVVWLIDHDKGHDLLAQSKPVFLANLQAQSRDVLGQVDALVVTPEIWPLISLEAVHMTAPKTILIAEAAHVSSPMGAQGLNMSLRDVACLVRLIDQALKNGQEIGDSAVLHAYETQRQRDISPRLKGIDLLHRCVTTPFAPVRQARRLGLQAVGVHSPLRSLLMREGLAPASGR